MRLLRSLLALCRYVSLRHALSAPLRSLLVLLGVALGVTMFVAVTAANQAVLRSFEELGRRASGEVDLTVSQDESGVPLALLDTLRAHPEWVAHVAPRMERTTFIADADGQPDERVLIVGLDFRGDHHFFPPSTGELKLANPMQFLHTPNVVLVNESLARRRNLQVGSTTRVRTARGLEELRVWGILPEDERSGAFGGQWMVMSLQGAQFAFGRLDTVDSLQIALAPGVTAPEATRSLQALIGEEAVVAPPGARAEQVSRMTRTFQLAIELQALLGLLVGLFLITNAVSVSVSERRREIGALRALGVSRWGVAFVFVAEAALVGALGSALGLAFAGPLAGRVLDALAPNVSRFYQEIAAPQATISPSLAAVGFCLGLLTTALAALAPAWRAATQAPVQALNRARQGPTAPPGPRQRLVGLASLGAGLSTLFLDFPQRGPLGLGLLILGAVALIPDAIGLAARILRPLAQGLLGVPGRLGIDNVARESRRSALTAAALMLATSASLTVATYTHSFETSCMAWIDQAIPADLFITAGSPVLDQHALSYDESNLDGLAEIPGIAEVIPLRSLTLQLGDRRMELQGLDSRRYLQQLAQRGGRNVVEGPSPLPPDALAGDEPSVVLSEGSARAAGLHLGDVITLPSPTGPHPFRVVGVVVDYSTDQGWGMVDRRWIRELWGDDLLDATDVFLAPGASPQAVAEAARATLGQGLFVTTNQAFKEEIRGVMRATLAASRAAELISLLVAVLGVVGALMAAVLDRQRELGVLRAIGATRSQVLASILAEAGFLGLLSAGLGAMLSVPAAALLMGSVGLDATGWSIPLQVPWLSGLGTVLGVLASALLAGLLPGAYAARVVVTRALGEG